MKKIITLSLSLLTLAFTAIAGGEDEGVLKVDQKKSSITWIGEKVTGSHTGNLTIASGELNTAKGLISNATIVMDMASITCTDLEDPEYNGKLVGHLKSADFFNVAEYKTAVFKLDKFYPQKGKDGNYMVEGTLTIKGITHPISFPADVQINGDEVTATANLSFDRSKYDIRYGSGSFFEGLGDNLIYDEVKVSFALSASK